MLWAAESESIVSRASLNQDESTRTGTGNSTCVPAGTHPRKQSADAAAGTSALGRSFAEPRVEARRTEQFAGKLECGAPLWMCEEAEVADLDEAGRQHVEQKAADELDGVQRHELVLVVIGRVSPAEGRMAIAHLDQAPVGDGHAMRVAGQVLEDMLGSAEGRLGIDHPLQSLELREGAGRTRRSSSAERVRRRV